MSILLLTLKLNAYWIYLNLEKRNVFGRDTPWLDMRVSRPLRYVPAFNSYGVASQINKLNGRTKEEDPQPNSKKELVKAEKENAFVFELFIRWQISPLNGYAHLLFPLLLW